MANGKPDQPGNRTWAGQTKRETERAPDESRSEKRANLEEKGERQTRLEESAGLGQEGQVAQSGASGGELARDIGKEDEAKRAENRPAGATRVTKADEAED